MAFVVPYAPQTYYQPNGRLVDLLRLQGENSADAQRRAGEIQARMWGNLGQNITESVGQVLKAKEQEPINTLNRLKVQEAQDLAKGQQVIDRGLAGSVPSGPQPEGTAPAAAQHPYLDEQGLVDPTKVRQLLEANGLAHVAPDLLSSVEKMNDGILKHNQLSDQLAKSNITMLGDWANSVTGLITKTQMPIDQAMDLSAQPYLMGKKIDPQQYAQQKAQILQLPPDQQLAALSKFMDAAEQANPDETLNKDAIKIGRYGRVKQTNIVPDKLGPADLEKAAMDAYARQSSGTATPADLATITGWEKTHPKAERPVTAEQDTIRATDIRTRMNLRQPVSAEEAAWLKSHETEKTLGVDLTAGMASKRQAQAIEASTAQQARAQNFQEQQQGRKELTEKVETPYQTAASSAQTLRDTVALAKSGNMTAAALQSLETTMAAIRAQGLNRINAAEIGVTGNAGSLWDNIVGKLGKVSAGQPVDATLQKDMQQFASMLEKAAYKKYLEGHSSITKRYSLTDEKPLPGPTIYARDPQGVLHAAPYGQKIPAGWKEE